MKGEPKSLLVLYGRGFREGKVLGNICHLDHPAHHPPHSLATVCIGLATICLQFAWEGLRCMAEPSICLVSRRPPHIISDVPTNTYHPKNGRLAMVAIFICRGSLISTFKAKVPKRQRRAKRRRVTLKQHSPPRGRAKPSPPNWIPKYVVIKP